MDTKFKRWRAERPLWRYFVPGKFDLVITDNAMEGMNGDQLAILLKERQPGQPVIMATAFVNNFDLPSTGVDVIVNKPYSHDEMKDAIARVMSPGADNFPDDLGYPIPLPPNKFQNPPRPSA